MSIAKKRANRNFNEIAASTTCAWKKSGLSHSMRRTRRLERKVGNRYEAALHWASFDDLDEPEATAVSTPPAAGEIYGSFYDLLDERQEQNLLSDLCVFDEDFGGVYDDDLYDVPDRASRFDYLYGDL